MGFVMGISTFSSSSQPHFFYSHHRKPHEFGKRRRIYACMQHHDPNDDVSCHRRAFLFMGVAVLPFLNLKARAFENLAPDESENSARAQELNQMAEVQTQSDASSNPVLTLSGSLGILASGVLGAFYALAQKEKSVDIATIESMKNKLVEKEAAILSMQKSFESKLQKEKESRKSLESNLEDATKALDETNQNTKILSQELEVSKNTISVLEDEKEVLYKSVDEQKQAIQVARENMEDAHNAILKLGKEKESLEKKVSKLEKELAVAKGEILQLRTVKNTSETAQKKENENGSEENAEKVNENGSEDEKETVTVKKVRRRKRVVSQQEES
ncbi:hypothetical protein HanHA300_Chr09g0341341 [Helianthus annuus]|nr:hypothetical protein HanHA300_Chr09g0341341 [Helianthus annuus]KAJ0544524.1 hypothetical protein HanHA89_Chr09g0362621 [Helianthus annuus]KAJ0709528.1 hypothetical protein HanLR1_Chr09g0341381 [Helianthus annuus]KAJ0713401.1 hypothetical protein HanOQP8_Chr09g0345471 [Helianthus annuus]